MLIKTNLAFLLAIDCIEAIGQSHCVIMSIGHLINACCTHRHSFGTQGNCRITSFYGSCTYPYFSVGMDLSVLPVILQQYH